MMSGKDRAEGALKLQTDSGKADADKVFELKKQIDELLVLTNSLKDRLDEGERQRAKLAFMRAELEEAQELVGDNQGALDEITKRLKELPVEEPYIISFDRATLKFVVSLVEKDLHKFRSSIIPNYEKASEEEFKDIIQTKTFWVNKARKSKDVLDKLKVKLEKGL
jgi:hypothetical protein